MILTHLLLLGFIGGSPAAGTGTITANAQATVSVLRVVGTVASGIGLPVGAPIWPQAFDPSEVTEFAINFGGSGGPLLAGEKIVAIERLAVSLVAAGHGIGIDQAAERAPFISDDGEMIQVTPTCSNPNNPAFEGLGILSAVSAKVSTNQGRTYERSVLLRARQQ